MQIQSSRIQEIFTHLVSCQGWFDVQNTIFDEAVCPVVGVPLELPVLNDQLLRNNFHNHYPTYTTTSQSLLVLPFLEVDGVEFLLEDESSRTDLGWSERTTSCGR